MAKSIYDFEERTLEFSKRILKLARALPIHERNTVLVKQIVRSGTSVGANYREAGDALGDKDFLHRLRIARKESKETTYWLQLIQEENPDIARRCDTLVQESVELTKILSAMITSAKEKHKVQEEEEKKET